MTEVNFGNDDETLGRLEDMGVAGGGLAGGDVSRQNSGAAQRRRQVGMYPLMAQSATSKVISDDTVGCNAQQCSQTLSRK